MKKVTHITLGTAGEFGNQLFEIAATVAYGLRYNRKAVFKDWKCIISGLDYSGILLNPLQYETIQCDQEHTEPTFYYTEIPPYEDKQNVGVKGYFQTEKYFSDFKKEIIDLFQPNKDIEDSLKKYDTNNSVCLQLRFYDKERPHNFNTGLKPCLDPSHVYYSVEEDYEFYKKALNYFGKNKTYYVCSNNYSKAKSMLKGYNNFILMENVNHIEAFYLQTKCEHNIISNSTYGWWGAYLNKTPDKVIFAPSNWFKVVDNWHQSKDILPKDWKN